MATPKYLRNFCEPECQLLNRWPEQQVFQHAVVIPCYRESLALLDQLSNFLLQHQGTLCILVINRPDTISLCDENKAVVDSLQQSIPSIWTSGILSLHPLEASAILLVDREQQPIPHKQGVGLARKIGSDIACWLHQHGNLLSHWVHSTDADTVLPADYFSVLSGVADHCSAAVYQFEHLTDSSLIGQATALYEKSLHYYVNGLKQADSPYAFHTIGSALAFTCEAYMAARGFPKRAGGEDFYLLNKLAKLGTVADLPATLKIQARLSDRVPFGTGPATQKIVAQLQNEEAFCSYHPEIFLHLKKWLEDAENALIAGPSLQEVLANQSTVVQSAVTDLGIDKLESHLLQCADSQQRIKHFHDWFDGFRTLKFVHYLQEHGLPPRPLI